MWEVEFQRFRNISWHMCIKVSKTINIFSSLYIDELLKQGFCKDTNFTIDNRVAVRFLIKFRNKINQKRLEIINLLSYAWTIWAVIIYLGHLIWSEKEMCTVQWWFFYFGKFTVPLCIYLFRVLSGCLIMSCLETEYKLF